MKRLSYIIRICAAALAILPVVASCTKEQDITPEEEGIVLTVSTAAPQVGTKSGEGRTDWNENKVTSVYYFLFRDGEHDTAPVIKGFFAGLNLNGDNPSKTWSIPVSSKTVLDDLFPAGVQICHAFVVANPPAEMAAFLEGDASGLTLDALHAYSFTTDLVGKQDSFVMTYEGDVDLISRTGGSDKVIARINAQLKRLAVKLTMHAKVTPNYIDAVTGEWTPQIEGLRASFHNAMSLTNLAGDFSTLRAVESSDFFNGEEAEFGGTRDVTFKTTDGVTVTGTMSDTDIPMYSYPMKWEFADRDEPFLFVELPWTRSWTDAGGTHQSTQTCYYKMMFSLKRIDANQWYDVTVTLDALGSFNKVEPTQQYLYEDYMVYDWNDAYTEMVGDTNVDAEVKEARYLVVAGTDYTLYDQEAFSIPFSSSHECTLTVKSAAKENLQNGTTTDLTSTAASWVSISSTGSVIEFNHTLNNTLGASLDISPYELTLLIKHSDNATYSETIHIRQFPAITVTKTLNSAVTKNGSSFTKSENYGYVYINSQTRSSGDNNAADEQFQVLGNNYMSNTNIGTGTNYCPYIYEIEVQSLKDDKYILSDPRTSAYSTLSYNSFGTAPALYEGTSSRKLTYYYPTISTTDAESSISPKFKVASSFGKTWDISYAEAQRRCAAYQEDGYPAGRWRIPTYAEIEFCLTLSNNKLIEVLFGGTGTSNYWYSTGYATIQANGTSITKHSGTSGTSEYAVRCVYDSWYWDEVDRIAGRTEQDRLNRRSTFTWGDQPR